MTKNLFIAIAGIVSAPVLELFEKYLFGDWDFFKFFFPLVVIDTFCGVLKNWKYGTLSSKAWEKVLWKLLTYGIILILAHIITHFTVEGKVVIVFSYFDEAIYSALVVKESISILENVGAINPNLVPKWLLQRLKQFDTSGKFSDLTDGEPVKQQ